MVEAGVWQHSFGLISPSVTASQEFAALLLHFIRDSIPRRQRAVSTQMEFGSGSIFNYHGRHSLRSINPNL